MDNLCDNEEDIGTYSDLNRNELLNVLVRLQGELDARDIVISTLQCELTNSICLNAKCHRYFLDDHFFIEPSDAIYALQRDEKLCGNRTCSLDINKCSIKSDSSGKNIHELCELIEGQQRIHSFYKEKLQSSEEKYIQLCSCIAVERQVHGNYKLQSSKNAAKLETENRNLKNELEAMRIQNDNLEEKLKTSLQNYAELKILTQKQRIVAAKLVKERRSFLRNPDTISHSSEFNQEPSDLVSTGHSSYPIPVSVGTNDITHDTDSLISSKPEMEADNCPEMLESLSIQVDITSDPSKVISSFADYEYLANSVNPVCSTQSIECSSPAENEISISNYVSVSSDSNNVLDECLSSFVLTKLRPEPPIRRTPEYTSPNTEASISAPISISNTGKPVCDSPDSPHTAKLISSSHFDKISQSQLLDIMEPEKSRASTPSPPPPPPLPMQLHYPYPGMHGNTCHPPLLSLSPHSRNSSSAITSPHHFPVSPPRVHSSRSPPVQQLFQNLNKLSTGIQKSRETSSLNSRFGPDRISTGCSQKLTPYISSNPVSLNRNTNIFQNPPLVSVDLNYPGDGVMSKDLSQLLSSNFIHSSSPPVPPVRPSISTVNYHLREGHASSPAGIIYSPRVVVTSRNSSTIPGGHLYINGK